MAGLDEIHFNQIPRAKNERADLLAKMASTPTADLGRAVYLEQLDLPSITKNNFMEIETITCWMGTL